MSTYTEHAKNFPAITEKLHEAVFTALGAASVCWSEGPKGVFLTEQVVKIGNELMEAVLKLTGANEPHLGLATTRELLNEISTRIEIDHITGMPGGLDYRTVGEDVGRVCL